MGAGREIPSLRLIQAREYGHNKQREGESRQERDRLGPPLRRGQEKRFSRQDTTAKSLILAQDER